MWPRTRVESGQKHRKAQRKGQSYFFLTYWGLVSPSTIRNKTGGKRIRCGFRSINGHAEQEDLNSAELETVRVSKSPTTVVTDNGEVQTNEEARTDRRPWFIDRFFQLNYTYISSIVTTGPCGLCIASSNNTK